MGRKKNPAKGDEPAAYDPHRKRFKPARIKGVLADAAEVAAAELAQDFTQYVNDAVRMRLASEGRWPPAPPAGRGR